MAVRTAYAPTAGEVLTAVNLEKMAGGWIGYDQIVADLTSATSLDVVSSGAVTVGTGRRIRISGLVNMLKDATAGYVEVYIMEGATQHGLVYFTGAASSRGYGNPSVILQPSAGSHTYKLSYTCSLGAATAKAFAIGPAFIHVEDVGT